MAELKQDLAEIKALLKGNEEKKEKKFKLPWSSRVNPKRAVKGWITVMKINENGFINASKEKIEEQTIMVDGIPRLATPEYIMHFKKNPIIFLPNWSVKPLTPKELPDLNLAENQKKSLDDGRNVKGYKILMAKMKSETISAKPVMGGWLKWIIGAGLVAIIIYAFISGGGK